MWLHKDIKELISRHIKKYAVCLNEKKVLKNNDLFIFYNVYLKLFDKTLKSLEIDNLESILYSNILKDINGICDIDKILLSKKYGISNINFGKVEMNISFNREDNLNQIELLLYLPVYYNFLVLEGIRGSLRYNNIYNIPFGGKNSVSLSSILGFTVKERYRGYDENVLNRELQLERRGINPGVLGYKYKSLTFYNWKSRKKLYNDLKINAIDIEEYKGIIKLKYEKKMFNRLLISLKQKKYKLEDKEIDDFLIKKYELELEDIDNVEQNLEVFYNKKINIDNKKIFRVVFEDIDEILKETKGIISYYSSNNLLKGILNMRKIYIPAGYMNIKSKFINGLIWFYLNRSTFYGIDLLVKGSNKSFLKRVKDYVNYRSEAYYLIMSGLKSYSGYIKKSESRYYLENKYIEFDHRVFEKAGGFIQFIVSKFFGDTIKSKRSRDLYESAFEYRVKRDQIGSVPIKEWDIKKIEEYSYNEMRSMFKFKRLDIGNIKLKSYGLFFWNMLNKILKIKNLNKIRLKYLELKYFIIDKLRYLKVYILTIDKRKVKEKAKKKSVGDYKKTLFKETSKNKFKPYKVNYDWYEEVVFLYMSTYKDNTSRYYNKIWKYHRREIPYNFRPFSKLSKGVLSYRKLRSDEFSYAPINPLILEKDDDLLLLNAENKYYKNIIYYNTDYLLKYRIRSLFIIPGYKFKRRNGNIFI